MKRLLALYILWTTALALSAKVVITQTSCNHQKAQTAIVEDKIRVGWQYIDYNYVPVCQADYQIEVRERVTDRLVYESGTVHSRESQMIELPPLAPNAYGYTWRVRINTDPRNIRPIRNWTDWSREQIIRVVPADLRHGLSTAAGAPPSPQWIGAITRGPHPPRPVEQRGFQERYVQDPVGPGRYALRAEHRLAPQLPRQPCRRRCRRLCLRPGAL